MLQEKIGKLFNFISETNITEEYSYLHKGKYPVYSGQTENEGIVSFIDYINKKDLALPLPHMEVPEKCFIEMGNIQLVVIAWG